MLAVGAARHDNTNDVLASSNRGPTVLPYPAGRTKPDIVGASCVATKTDPPELCGTSAAAPHIAGLAALVRERYPTYTPAQVATYLKTNALVRGGSVPNHEWGNGFAYLPPQRRYLTEPVDCRAKHIHGALGQHQRSVAWNRNQPERNNRHRQPVSQQHLPWIHQPSREANRQRRSHHPRLSHRHRHREGL